MENDWIKINAEGLNYFQLNQIIREKASLGFKKIEIHNVFGQRYIGTNLFGTGVKGLEIKLFGTPGNDLAAFMDGSKIEVFGNVQDGCGNTMNDGEIIVHGGAGDILGYGMRGGRLFIRDNVGYRAAIHMKEHKGKKPVVVIGGLMQDFFGEYMAGGIVLLLALNLKKDHRPSCFVGTGMHGGIIFIRGKLDKYQIGKEVGITEPSQSDWELIKKYTEDFANYFNLDLKKIYNDKFIKLYPKYLRPYGKLYAY